jgi:predicted RNase H-like HicB family nuclease
MAGAGKLHFELHALVFEAEDAPGTWLAHCLELDLVTCGNTAEHAMKMLDEAIELVSARRAQDGEYPFDFRTAPREAWFKFQGAEHAFAKTIALPPGDVTIDYRAA